MSISVVSFGEVLWDIIDNKEYIGGAPFNVSAHLAKLGCNAAMVTRLGTDERGRKALDAIRRLGVSTELVQIDPERPTGTAEVRLAEGGVPTFFLPPGAAYEFITIGEDEIKKLSNYELFCFGSIVQKARVSRDSLRTILSRVRFDQVFFDVNIRLGFCPQDVIEDSFAAATIVKLNDEEVRIISKVLYGSACTEEGFVRSIMTDYNIGIVCVTKGKDGCTVYDTHSSKSFSEQAVQVADTVGAGDAFSAAFLYTYSKTGDPFESARIGNIMGAFVASQSGAIPEYSDEIKRLIGV